MRRVRACRVAVLPWLLIVALLALRPLGLLEHVVHDHLGDHGHDSHASVAHPAEAGAADHDADHAHAWATAAVVVVTTSVDRPQGLRARVVIDDVPPASAAPQPPFSPPRA